MSRAARSRYEDGDEEEMSGRESDQEHMSLTHAHQQESKHNGTNNTLFGGGASSSLQGDGSSGGGMRDSAGIREGMEVEEDDDEEVEIDSDLENELDTGADSAAQGVMGADGIRRGGGGHGGINGDKELEQPQQCDNKLVLYIMGIIACLACEFLILFPAYYLPLFVIGLLYGVLWVSMAGSAAFMRICPGKRRPHSTLALALYLAALAAYVGGMTGSYYYKQVWHFDQIDSQQRHTEHALDTTCGK